MLRTRIKAALSALSSKRTVTGWVLFLGSILLWVSDKWDSINSFFEKVKRMGPIFHFLVEAAKSPLFQLTVFVVGIVWVGVAALLASRPKVVSASAKGKITALSKRLDTEIERGRAKLDALTNRKKPTPSKLTIACDPTVSSPPQALLASQIQELKALKDFVGGKGEGELRELFDLPGITRFNIRRGKASLHPNVLTPAEAAEIDAFFKDGQAILDARYCTVTRTAGGFHNEPSQGKLGILNLSRKYVTNRQTLAKFQSSPQLPFSIRNAVQELDGAVAENVQVLLNVINQELAEHPDNILFEEDGKSRLFGAASGAFLDKRIWLKPKQEAIMSAITDYLEAE